MEQEATYVGVDVAKARLDVAILFSMSRVTWSLIVEAAIFSSIEGGSIPPESS